MSDCVHLLFIFLLFFFFLFFFLLSFFVFLFFLSFFFLFFLHYSSPSSPSSSSSQAEEERGDMEKVKLDNKRILFNLLPAHVAQHFLMSNPRNMVSSARPGLCAAASLRTPAANRSGRRRGRTRVASLHSSTHTRALFSGEQY